MQKNDGMALIIVLLAVSALLTSLLGLVSIMIVSVQRTQSSHAGVLRAQYAAESGFALAHAQALELEALLLTLRVPAHETEASLEEHARRYCNRSLMLPSPSSLGSTEHPQEGRLLCQAVAASSPERYSLFRSYTPAAAYPSGESAASYWPQVFEESTREVTLEAGLSYRLRGAYTPKEVRLTPYGYRFLFTPPTSYALGELAPDGQLRALRALEQSPLEDAWLEIHRPPLSRYAYLAYEAEALPFAPGDNITGAVHLNSRTLPLTPQHTSRYLGGFSSAAPLPAWGERVLEQLLPGGYRFNAPEVSLSTDATAQRSAAGVPLTEAAGVYYGLGGIFVRGDVHDLRLSSSGNRSLIRLETAAGVTEFRQASPGWDVYENGERLEPLDDFNGVLYIEGSILSLGGDGSASADLAPDSAFLVVAEGDITLTRDLSYSRSVRDGSAESLLGIYSAGGDLVVGARALEIHASLIAPGVGRGLRGAPGTQLTVYGSLQEYRASDLPLHLTLHWDERLAEHSPPHYPQAVNWLVNVSPLDVPTVWRNASVQ